jgi:hypothetical protein
MGSPCQSRLLVEGLTDFSALNLKSGLPRITAFDRSLSAKLLRNRFIIATFLRPYTPK